MWSTEGKSEALQSLLGLLLEAAWGKVRTALGKEGAACPKDQSNAILPVCFPHSPPRGEPAEAAPVPGVPVGPCVIACMGMEGELNGV